MVQKINVGNQSNDGTGDSIREAFKKVNDNFTELYGINNLGEGLYLTKLKDTPQKLIASSTSTATILVVDYSGSTMTQRHLVAGQGIVISNSNSGTLTISNPNSSLNTDLFPELGGNLNGQNYKAYNFANPTDLQDLATKYYVDNNSPYSRTNLFVSTNGRDEFPVDVPPDRRGRSLAYAYRTINKACEAAETIINTSTLELSAYQQYITIDNGDTTATVFAVTSSTSISGATRVLVNLDLSAGTDQYLSKFIRPGQRILGRDSQTFGFVDSLGLTTSYGYDEAKCARDVGYIVDAVTADLVLGSNYRSVTAGLAYLRAYSGVVYNTQNSQTIQGINKARDLVLSTVTNVTAQGIITDNFAIITNILASGAGAAPTLVFNTVTNTSAHVKDAASIVQANKSFLQDEIIAYIETYPTPIPNYNSANCRRDVGFIIDALTFDLLYGGNVGVQLIGDAYFLNGVSVIPGEVAGSTYAYNRLSVVLNDVVQNNPIVRTTGNNSTQNTSTYSAATTAEGGILGDLVNEIISIISGTPVTATPSTYSNGPSAYVTIRNSVAAYTPGIKSQVISYINGSGNYEFYDVQVVSGPGFVTGEPILFAQTIPKKNITIIVESGTYEEQLPIRVPANVSIRGDEFRRTIIKPAPLASTSKWANIWFRRDEQFDGLTAASNNGQANLAIDPNNRYAYHYLTNPTDKNSTPKLNADMDVFLLNDQTILRGITAQGHGGFMCVLDPEGQILTKSPYMQNCASFSRSTNEQVFAGGTYVDGFVGNLEANPSDAFTYFTGTTTFTVTGLNYRQPQTPTAFYYLGNRYEVDYITDFDANLGTARLYLNPANNGGIAYTSGTITVNAGVGYSTAPYVLFDQPTSAGGYGARGIAHLNAGAIDYITITNPGTGYDPDTPVNVQFIGGNPLTPASTITIPTSKIAKGFIGVLPSTIDLITAGNKSMLNADFTQVNDQGYGIVVTNNSFQENVSIFTYYAHVAYYANNGGQFRSLNGSNAYGNFALKSAGSDPNEIPIPILITDDMVQTATVVSYNYTVNGGTLNTVNTSSSAFIYVRGQSYIPYNQSEVDIDHGLATDTQGNILGIQTYQVISANTATGTPISDLILLNLSTGASLGLGAGGLKAPVSSGTVVTIRGNNVFKVVGVNNKTFLRTASVGTFNDSTGTVYRVINYDSAGVNAGESKLTFKDAYNYIQLQTYSGITPKAGTDTIAIYNLTTTATSRLNYYTTGTGFSTFGTYTQMAFGWKGGIYRVTEYKSSATIAQPYATIKISPALGSTITNVANTVTTYLKLGLRKYSQGEITNRISVLRVTGHDLVDIGSGGFAATRIPNDLYGPPDNKPSSVKERIEVGKGRVFAVTTDQDGNFKVGDVFQINQSTGDLTISASLSLTGVDGLGFKRGTTVREISIDDTMVKEAADSVPTEGAIVGYINHRLGINALGSLQSKIGNGFLDLTGIQPMIGTLKMNGNAINMANAKVTNLTTATSALDATNKVYVDTKISLGGVSGIDPATGSANSAFGIMTGRLQLYQDPLYNADGSTAATKRYVDRLARQVSTLTDVNFTKWPNLPADKDFVMFNSTTLQVNTGTTASVWVTATQITNVANNVATVTNTATGNGGGSDITVARTNNSVTFKLVGGQGTNNPITNYHVNDSAAIAQSKLSMNAANASASTSSGIAQANLGLSTFDSKYFSASNGWISLNSPSDLVPKVACRTTNNLATSGYLIGNSFNGTTSTTWSINAASTNTSGAIVARDTNGNFGAGTITAGLSGIATCAQYLQIDSGSYYAACTTTNANTVVARDSSCNINAKCFVGTATSALYADLAENYRADKPYPPCTVLQFGGTCEVTIAGDGTRAVAGVVSTNPAHLMNSALVGDNVVKLALTGRVPVKVRGKIRKGDMMVSAGDGYARPEFNPVIGSVIGKALEDFDGIEGIIEVVVGRL